ncbi:MAG TPA: phytoene/squalene synthase family protein [Sphingobium sp.]|nr:phytoene/squalene synthase family protein [Sphingobium sp.]
MVRGSKSFALASKLFDRQTRERAWLLYAWCRKCDDIADGQDHGGAMTGVTDGQARLAAMRAQTDAALRGDATGDLAFDGFGLVMRECAIPRRYAHDLLEGFALDAVDWRPTTEADMLRYCYHVAGAVGCMMAVLMGVHPQDEATLDRACDLGLAFQLANIARDIGEDQQAGRCYLPQQWLEEMGIPPGRQMEPAFRPQLTLLAQRLTSLAADYEASARHGTGALPPRAAWAVLAAAGIYGDIAREVARRGARAWDDRVVTPKSEKLGWVCGAGIQILGRSSRWPASAARPPHLWTRPRG